jgi:hypothetical protein
MVWIVIEKAEREIASVAKYTPIASRGVTVIETPTSFARVISMADCAPAALLGEHLISLFIADAVWVLNLLRRELSLCFSRFFFLQFE